MSTKRKNPLYVVTQKGKVVEEAQGPIQALIKRFNLGPLIEMLMELMKGLLSQVQTYPIFKAIVDCFNFVIARLKLLTQYSII